MSVMVAQDQSSIAASTAEARRATLDQFAQLPPEMQTAFLQRTFEQPQLRANPELLHDAMRATLERNAQRQQPSIELGALLQLSSQLTPAGKGQEAAQQAALEQHATVTQLAQVEVKQALDRGENPDQIKAKAASTDIVAQAAVTTVVQEHKEKEHQQKTADNDAEHRKNTGLAEAELHPLAAALARNAGAATAFVAALGGHTQDHAQDQSTQAVVKVAQAQDTGRGGVA